MHARNEINSNFKGVADFEKVCGEKLDLYKSSHLLHHR